MRCWRWRLRMAFKCSVFVVARLCCCSFGCCYWRYLHSLPFFFMPLSSLGLHLHLFLFSFPLRLSHYCKLIAAASLLTHTHTSNRILLSSHTDTHDDISVKLSCFLFGKRYLCAWNWRNIHTLWVLMLF